MPKTADKTFPYEYRWDRQGRKGEPCRVLVRGKMNSCSVEFLDGFKMVTSRNALRKRKPTEIWMDEPICLSCGQPSFACWCGEDSTL